MSVPNIKQAAAKAFIWILANPALTEKSLEPFRQSLYETGHEARDGTPWWSAVNDALSDLNQMDSRKLFDALPSVPKKQFLKAKPGTWVLVKWMDDMPLRVMILFKPQDRAGEISMKCYDPHSKIEPQCTIVHTQVIAIGPQCQVPDFNA